MKNLRKSIEKLLKECNPAKYAFFKETKAGKTLAQEVESIAVIVESFKAKGYSYYKLRKLTKKLCELNKADFAAL